jgi:hypothetical protein
MIGKIRLGYIRLNFVSQRFIIIKKLFAEYYLLLKV